jgi:hypothetical protein
VFNTVEIAGAIRAQSDVHVADSPAGLSRLERPDCGLRTRRMPSPSLPMPFPFETPGHRCWHRAAPAQGAADGTRAGTGGGRGATARRSDPADAAGGAATGRPGTAPDRRRRADAALARGDRHTGPRESAQRSRTLGYLAQVALAAMVRVDARVPSSRARGREGPRVVRRPAAHDRPAAEGARRLKRKPCLAGGRASTRGLK